MPILRKWYLLVALAVLGACNFLIIPVPIPRGTTAQQTVVPVDDPRADRASAEAPQP